MGFSPLGTSEKAPEFNLARKFAGLIAYLQAQLTSQLLDNHPRTQTTNSVISSYVSYTFPSTNYQCYSYLSLLNIILQSKYHIHAT